MRKFAYIFAGAAVAVAVGMPVAAYAASLQSQIDNLQVQIDAIEPLPGPQGPQGPQGPEGPEGPAGADGSGGGVAFQLTLTDATTDGIISTSEWNDECVALGGRAANTKDLLTLPWDPLDAGGSGWVRPYFVGNQVDITGVTGGLGLLACESVIFPLVRSNASTSRYG